MSIRRDITATLMEAERDLGGMQAGVDTPMMVWKGASLPCIPSFERTGTLIEAEGNPLLTDLWLLVRRENFSTSDSVELTADSELLLADNETPAPRSGEVVRFEARQYKVLTREWCSARAYVRFGCGDVNSGR